MAYRFDYQWIKSLIGSRDRNFLSGFLLTQQAKFNELDDFIDSDKPSIEAAIAMFTQQERSDLCGATCWYLIEAAIDCSSSSEFLPNHHWYPSGIADFHLQLPQTSNGKAALRQLGIPDPDDFPAVHLYLSEDLPAMYDHIQDHPDIVEDDEQRDQLLLWVSSAQKNNQDLIIFNY